MRDYFLALVNTFYRRRGEECVDRWGHHFNCSLGCLLEWVNTQ